MNHNAGIVLLPCVNSYTLLMGMYSYTYVKPPAFLIRHFDPTQRAIKFLSILCCEIMEYEGIVTVPETVNEP